MGKLIKVDFRPRERRDPDLHNKDEKYNKRFDPTAPWVLRIIIVLVIFGLSLFVL